MINVYTDHIKYSHWKLKHSQEQTLLIQTHKARTFELLFTKFDMCYSKNELT